MDKFLSAAAVFCSIIMVGCGSAVPDAQMIESSASSVSIKTTSIKNQKAVGFCWAYATMGFIESNYKMQKRLDLNLSEEALGFHRQAYELLALAKDYQKGEAKLEDISNTIKSGQLEGWWSRLPDSEDVPDGYELVDAYGVVPEDVWNYKITTSEMSKKFNDTILKRYLSYLKREVVPNIEDIEKVLVAPGAYPSAPPSKFIYKSKSYTAVEFAKSELNFRGSSYSVIEAKNNLEIPKLITAAKRTLIRGLTIPFSYWDTDDNFSQEDKSLITYPVLSNTEYNKMTEPLAVKKLGKNGGGHAVLVTDFVNQGGSEGAMSKSELEVELHKAPSQFNYFIFKNSWGVASNTENGFNRIDLGYINMSAFAQVMSVVVPRDIIEIPAGKDIINLFVVR